MKQAGSKVRKFFPSRSVPAMIQESEIARAGQVADEIASRGVFTEYRDGLAERTRVRQDADLALFTRYLHAAGITQVGDLAYEASAWRDISGGLVKGFRRWMLREGYAIGSVNVRLSTVKRYASLAFDAKELDEGKKAMIQQVHGIRYSEGINIDKERQKIRVGAKKASPIRVTPETAYRLKNEQPDIPQGRRDAVLMCLLLDHGFRCGEVALLQVAHINLDSGLLICERPKVYKVQTHRLTPDTLAAMRRYIETDKPDGWLLQSSRKDGTLIGGRMRQRAITARVRVLGESVNTYGLSAHDCRHYWATMAARNKTDAKSLQTAGGWNSPAMPMRYIEEAEIANEGVKLS